MKPIGSEKIQNPDEKLARILEIAGVKKDAINESKPLYGRLGNVLHEAVAADGAIIGGAAATEGAVAGGAVAAGGATAAATATSSCASSSRSSKRQ